MLAKVIMLCFHSAVQDMPEIKFASTSHLSKNTRIKFILKNLREKLKRKIVTSIPKYKLKTSVKIDTDCPIVDFHQQCYTGKGPFWEQ